MKAGRSLLALWLLVVWTAVGSLSEHRPGEGLSAHLDTALGLEGGAADGAARFAAAQGVAQHPCPACLHRLAAGQARLAETPAVTPPVGRRVDLATISGRADSRDLERAANRGPPPLP